MTYALSLPPLIVRSDLNGTGKVFSLFILSSLFQSADAPRTAVAQGASRRMYPKDYHCNLRPQNSSVTVPARIPGNSDWLSLEFEDYE
jgi:hypothetical protein